MTVSRLLSLHSVALRIYAFHPCEEAAEAALVGEMEALCNVGKWKVGCLQQPRGFHQQHLVDIVHHGAARHLADYAREVNRGDVETLSIESYVVMLNEVGVQQAHKGDELFRGALADLSRAYVLGHGIHQVKYKLGEQCAQRLVQVAVVRVLIADNLKHVLPEVSRLPVVKMYDGAAEFRNGLIGGVNDIAHGWNLKCRLFVNHQADGMIVL